MEEDPIHNTAPANVDNEFDNQYLKELFEVYHQTKDVKVRTVIIERFEAFAAKVARSSFPTVDVDLADELVAESMITLVKCVDNYDLSRNVAFATYLSKQIRGDLMHYLRDFNHIIHRPGWISELETKYKKAYNKFLNENGRPPKDNEELAKYLGLEVSHFKPLENDSLGSICSLNQATVDDESYHLIDLVVDDDASDPIGQVWLKSIFDENNYLTPLELRILQLSLIYSPSKIANRLKCSPVHIRNTYIRAIKKLRILYDGASQDVPVPPIDSTPPCKRTKAK